MTRDFDIAPVPVLPVISPSPDDVNSAVNLLSLAKKPLVIVGQGDCLFIFPGFAHFSRCK